VGSLRDDLRKLINQARAKQEEEARLGHEPRIEAYEGDPPELDELARVPCSDQEAQLIREDPSSSLDPTRCLPGRTWLDGDPT
jgi:hypothetical protein